ncbi:MAG TPA: hypothetical protein VFV07_03570 [Rhizomicrobium sp.]|nr:hypothetical protein [Rhizomicrobium sp.]
MPTFKLPLSGNVTQSINPWTWIFNPMGSQVGLININLGKSSNPDVEQEVLDDVASYGRQLGRIGDALLVLVDHFPDDKLAPKEKKAFADLRAMLAEIAAVKAKYPPTTAP